MIWRTWNYLTGYLPLFSTSLPLFWLFNKYYEINNYLLWKNYPFAEGFLHFNLVALLLCICVGVCIPWLLFFIKKPVVFIFYIYFFNQPKNWLTKQLNKMEMRQLHFSFFGVNAFTFSGFCAWLVATTVFRLVTISLHLKASRKTAKKLIKSLFLPPDKIVWVPSSFTPSPAGCSLVFCSINHRISV